MFGYILVNKPELKIKEFDLYRSYYCGVCRSLKKRHGLAGRMTLNYDMAFLAMLLSDLYDREDCETCRRCIVHPMEKHFERQNEISDYCADMCVYLAYYKCVDDWNDEHKFKSWFLKKILSRSAKKVRALYPEKTAAIERKLDMLTAVENTPEVPMDKVAKIFGEVMAEAFLMKDDFWKDDLYRIGFFLGKFIYLLDAYEDVEKDMKTGDYNPYKELFSQAKESGSFDSFNEQVLSMLLLMIGEATDAFERLPLIENVEILRNILYSGVWVRFEKCRNDRQKAAAGDKEGQK